MPISVMVIPSWFPTAENPAGAFFQLQSEAVSKLECHVHVLAPIAVSIRRPIRWMLAWKRLFGAPNTKTINGTVRVTELLYPNFPLVGFMQRLLFGAAVGRMFEYLRGRGVTPDVVHAHSLIWAGVAARRLFVLHQIPYVVTEHRGRFVRSPEVPRAQLISLRSTALRNAINDADHLFCVGSRMIPTLESISGSEKPKIEYLPNMVDSNFFTSSPLKNHSPLFRFISVAGLVPSKGFTDLIDAFAIVRQDIAEIELVVLGDGPMRSKLERQIRKKKLQNHIELKGHCSQQEVRDAMRLAHAFVLATRYEAQGVVFLEAQAFGLPIVSTRSGGPEDVVSAESGLLSDVGSTEQLAANMKKMIQTYGTFDQAEIRQSAERKFSEKAVARRLVDQFRAAVHRKQASE